MAGHVNMMDDVLVMNLPDTILRSALRLLISQGAATQRPFVQHVQERLMGTKPSFTPPTDLFPAGSSEASPALTDYLALTRCIFSCKLVAEAMPYLIHLLRSIVAAQAVWSKDTSLETTLTKAAGDIVQAIQALKESGATPTEALEALLRDLVSSMQACREYCEQAQIEYLFSRPERQVKDVVVYMFPQLAGEFLQPAPGETLNVRLPKCSQVETVRLGPTDVPRLLNGFWQLSSPAWGSGTAKEQTRSLVRLVESGLTAADMADHYGDAELIYGDFRNRLPDAVRAQVFCATKWCVFGSFAYSPQGVLDMVKERSRRVGGRVELLQFHWNDYNQKDYLAILAELVRITKTHPQLVSSIGLCNFDSDHTAEVCEYLLKTIGAVGIVSNQVQFSLFDSRPRKKMADVCDKYGVKLLVYGAFCGGMLSSKWQSQPQPEIYAAENSLTPSQRKYLDIILTWSSWDDFQHLLSVLSSIAQVHGVSLTNVATRWVLQQRAVGAVIVGTRLGVSGRWEENLKAFGWELNEEELGRINEVALGKNGERCDRMLAQLGDCGNEYRALH